MKPTLLAILAAFCFTVGACSKNTATSEAPAGLSEPANIEPEVILEPATELAPEPAVVPAANLEDDPFGEIPEPVKPTPAPPVAAEAADEPPAPPEDSVSAAEVMDSVGRVLRRTIGADEESAESKGSIFRSIGRALTKGAQEAASAERESVEE